MLGKSNSRVPPLALLAAMAYLDSRLPENCVNDPNCTAQIGESDEAKIKDPLDRLERKILLNILATGSAANANISKNGALQCGFTYDVHGAAFEIFMTAIYHMAYEFLGNDDNFKVIELQKRNVVSLVEPLKPSLGVYPPEEKSVNNSKVFETYERYTDIVLQGVKPQPIYVELKSYPAHYLKTKYYYDTATKRTIEKKFPIWEKLKKSEERGTTVHRQLILDAVLSSSHPNFISRKNEIVASDFHWYFQDWPLIKPHRRQKNIRDNGNALSRVEIRTMHGTSAFSYMRKELLSQLGNSPSTKSFVAWNVGRNDSLGSMYTKLRSTGDGGLQSRVKVFSLLSLLGKGTVDGAFGGISKDDLMKMLKNGIGLEEKDIDVFVDAEKYQEKVLEHLTAMRDQIAEELEVLPGIESEDVKEMYEEILEEIREKQSRIDELETEAIDTLAEIFPDFGATECY